MADLRALEPATAEFQCLARWSHQVAKLGLKRRESMRVKLPSKVMTRSPPDGLGMHEQIMDSSDDGKAAEEMAVVITLVKADRASSSRSLRRLKGRDATERPHSGLKVLMTSRTLQESTKPGSSWEMRALRLARSTMRAVVRKQVL